jgi:hypothetical protein
MQPYVSQRVAYVFTEGPDVCVFPLVSRTLQKAKRCVILLSEYCRSSLAAISAVVWTTMLFQKTFQNMQKLSVSIYTTVNIPA